MALPQISAVVTEGLKSQQVRSALANLFGGDDRTIERGENGLFESAGSIIQAALSFLGGLLGFAQWSLSSLIGWLQTGTYYIWNFNWNQTDAQLNSQLEAAQAGLAGISGGALGNFLGYATCGIIPAAGITVFSPQLGLYLLREVGEEAAQEAVGYISAMASASFSLSLQTIFFSSFKGNRALYNAAANIAGNALDLVIPGNLNWDKYREQRSKENGLVSFSDFVEESLETLPIPAQAFFESFFEELGEGCFEALYVLAGSFDNWLGEQKLAKEQILGPRRQIEVTPNREIPNEKILLVGPEELLKQDLVTTLSHYQLLDNKDIGQFVGQPAEEYCLAKRLGLRVKLELYPYPAPNFYRGENIRPRQVTFNVPDVLRTKLDFATLKAACGGSNGYQWGRYLALAKLDNGRQLQVYGANPGAAEGQLKRLLSLTDAKIVTLSINETQLEGELQQRPVLRKNPRIVYPGYVTIWNRDELLDTVTAGRSAPRGNFKDKNARLPLWMDSKPLNFDSVIAEVLLRGVTGITE